jgi:hypothetical protein
MLLYLYNWGVHMRKNKRIQIYVLFSLIILISTAIPLNSEPIEQNVRNNDTQSNIKPVIKDDNGIEKGKRWDIDNITIIYINGTFYEMGYKLGELLKAEMYINQRAFQTFYESEGIYLNELIDLWLVQKEYISQEVKDFIAGTADALDVSFEEIACIWVAEGAAYYNKCSSFSAWGDATYDGELIMARSLEFPLNIIDPLTNSFIQDFPVIVIADPAGDEYNAFMYPTFAGYVVEDGFNENGISISNMWSPNNDQKINGAPMGIRLFEALYSSNNALDAINIITSDRTFGYNFIVSDAKVPIGYAVETTANHYHFGTWNDPIENIRPFWEIRDVVRRTNCFLSPELAKTQRDNYNPRHISYVLGLLNGDEPWLVLWNHYKALSKGIEENWGKINLIDAILIMRRVYHGDYDPMWNIILNTMDEWTTWWQWVAKPKTGEVMISFADGEISAHYTPVFSINLLKTIENKTPS